MQILRLGRPYFATALIVASMALGSATAQSTHIHKTVSNAQALTNSQGALLHVVRQATAKYKDVAMAEADEYHLMFGCVTGPDSGAMGLHYVNMTLVGGGEVDATKPQIVIYEPEPNGHLRLIGADFLVLADQWDKAHPTDGPPQLMGQLFHYFESPNRFGLPAFYTLHVWAWKPNPNGAFVNWHPDVSCSAFAGQAQ